MRASCSEPRAQDLSFRPSDVASLKFRMPLPRPRPMSGSRLAPKIRMMMKRMTSSSGIPRWPNMATPWSRAVRGNSITLCPDRPAARLAVAALTVAAVAGLSAAVVAQFASGVNVVEVYATVTDAAGEPVTGLTQADFIVRENGDAQQVSTFAAGEFPLSVAI